MRKTRHPPKQMEHPVIFKAEMVRSILDGRKTQTRRIMKPQPSDDFSPSQVEMYAPNSEDKDGFLEPGPEIFGCYDKNGENEGYKFPYGVAGSKLWVRETWRPLIDRSHSSGTQRYAYRADHPAPSAFDGTWKPSIHMPRWASRITLEITGVRVERLQDIGREDAKAEGVSLPPTELYPDVNTGDKLREQFRKLWDSINGVGAWDKNDWVWVIDFCRVGNDAVEHTGVSSKDSVRRRKEP